jgi:tetratricopeptide (TPR) repeat protein
MPELVQEFIPNIPRISAVFALFPVCFKVFAWVEDRLSANAKQEISAWLKSTGDFATNQISAFNLSHFHSQLFGDKQFSIKCGARTLLFSLISFSIIFFPIIFGFVTLFFKNEQTKILFAMPGQAQVPVVSNWTGGLSGIIVLLFTFTLIVLPLDFVGIGVTRALAIRAKNDIGLKNGLRVFLLDALAKTIIFPIIYIIFSVVILAIFIIIIMLGTMLLIHKDVPIHIMDLIDIIIINFGKDELLSLIYAAIALYKSLVPCFLLCSAWVWLYLIGLHLVRRAVFLFDVDKQPVRSIGIIGAAVLTGSYGLFTAIGPNLKFGSQLSSDEIAYLDQQNSDRTIAGLDAAIRLDPKSAGLRTLRAGYYWDKHDYDAALADLDVAIGLNPNSASLFVARGNAYHAKRDYDRAIADDTEVIRLDKNYGVAFNNRGWAYAAKQDYDRAIADYTESIRIDPKYALAFDNRGNAYYGKHDTDRAIADFTEAIRLNSDYAFAFSDRGRVYSSKQNYDRAIADYTEAIRIDPKFALAFRRRGIAYSAKQDYGDALTSLADAVRLDPKSAVSVLWLYLVRARSNAEAAAAELETNAKNLKLPDWPYAAVELFLGRQTPETTLAAATKPDERCQAQFYVGEWHLLQGNRPAAEMALETAVDSCPKTLMEYDVARAELRRLRP